MPQFYQTTQIAKPAYYDRDPISVIPLASFAGGPHGDTIRATYTPPFPFATFIEAVYTSTTIQTAAGAVVQTFTYLEYVPFYGGSIIILNCQNPQNAPNFSVIAQLQQFGYMAFGDTLRMHTGNLNTGGSVSHYMTAKGVEFQY